MNRIHRVARDLAVLVTAMWVTAVGLLVVVDNTNLVVAISQRLPAAHGEHQFLYAGNTMAVLSGLSVALPALLILLITAGVLRRPGGAR